MNGIQLYNQLIQEFILINSMPELWYITNNDCCHTIVHTKLSSDIQSPDLVALESEEYPFLECNLPEGHYFLVTTDRIISYYRGCLQIQKHIDFINFDFSSYKFIDRDNKNQKTEFYILEYKDDKLFYEIDSYAPAHLAIELIRILQKYFTKN